MKQMIKIVFTGLLSLGFILSTNVLAEEKNPENADNEIAIAKRTKTEAHPCQFQSKDLAIKDLGQNSSQTNCLQALDVQPPVVMGATVNFTVNGKPFASAVENRITRQPYGTMPRIPLQLKANVVDASADLKGLDVQ